MKMKPVWLLCGGVVVTADEDEASLVVVGGVAVTPMKMKPVWLLCGAWQQMALLPGRSVFSGGPQFINLSSPR